MARVHALLTSPASATATTPADATRAVVDADAIRTQLSPEDGWNYLKPPTFAPDAVVLKEDAVFHPAGIEHRAAQRRRPGRVRDVLREGLWSRVDAPQQPDLVPAGPFAHRPAQDSGRTAARRESLLRLG